MLCFSFLSSFAQFRTDTFRSVYVCAVIVARRDGPRSIRAVHLHARVSMHASEYDLDGTQRRCRRRTECLWFSAELRARPRPRPIEPHWFCWTGSSAGRPRSVDCPGMQRHAPGGRISPAAGGDGAVVDGRCWTRLRRRWRRLQRLVDWRSTDRTPVCLPHNYLRRARCTHEADRSAETIAGIAPAASPAHRPTILSPSVAHSSLSSSSSSLTQIGVQQRICQSGWVGNRSMRLAEYASITAACTLLTTVPQVNYGIPLASDSEFYYTHFNSELKKSQVWKTVRISWPFLCFPSFT